MPGAARLGDHSKCPFDAHGCKVCSHVVQGPATQGSTDVFINGKPALRQGDMGIHGICCGSNTWVATSGSPTVFINGKPAVRMHDSTSHCGGSGKMIHGSSDVIIGNGQSKLFEKAAKTRAPFVDNTNQTFLKRTKENLRDYLQERGTENYSKGNHVAAFIDAIGEGLVSDMPETKTGAALGIATDIGGGKAIKIIGKGGKMAIKKADDFIGKLKGKRVRLKGVKTKRIKYKKRTPEATEELRKQFNSTERKKFIKSLVDDPKKVEAMREAGISDKMIERMKTKGKPPKNWQVHHKLPLDDGGTNDFDNLVLVKNHPYHKAITNAQRELTKGLEPGKTVEIDFPVPEGFLYPTK